MTEEAYIHSYVTRPDAKVSLGPPFSFSEDEDDSDPGTASGSDSGSPPRQNNRVVSIELRAASSLPRTEEKEDAFSYKPAAHH